MTGAFRYMVLRLHNLDLLDALAIGAFLLPFVALAVEHWSKR